jgi:hypothetical protein
MERFITWAINSIRLITLTVMFTGVSVCTGFGFAHSYAGLYAWGTQHLLTGWKADSFPLLIDMFILVGELGLFLLALDGYKMRKSVLAWSDMILPFSVASAGWSVSLWFNIGHVQDATTDDKITAGVPPVAAMIGLVILLRTVHRYTGRHLILIEKATAAQTEPADAGALATVTALAVRPVRKGDLLMISPPVPDPCTDTYRLPGTYHAGTKVGSVQVRMYPDPEPFPEPVSTDPVPVAPLMVQKPVPVKPAVHSGTPSEHPKWDEGVKIYRESINPHTGKGLSQRDLAAALGMRNRQLAAQIINHVRESDG